MKHLVLVVLILIGNQRVMGQTLDIQGHRGFRGLMPENTIEGFLMALDSGVTTLEMDVVISGDSNVVVSHEHYMNASFCLTPEGAEIAPETARDLNIYQMSYDEIKRYDCGSKGNTRFPLQAKFVARKPLLTDVIRNVERYIKDYTGQEVYYNIELKSSPSGDGVWHPDPARFSKIVYETIDEFLPMERVVIQSFDFRILKYWHENYPQVRLAALVENRKSIDTNLANLGFKPHIYSPYFQLLSKAKVKNIQKRGIDVIPWTVNDKNDMERVISWEVNGIITDFPNVLHQLLHLPED